MFQLPPLDFRFKYAILLTTAALVGNAYVAWAVAGGEGDVLAGVLSLCGWLTLPYFLLAAFTWVIRWAFVLWGATSLLVLSEAMAFRDALLSEGAAAIAFMVFQPYTAVKIVVGALLLGLLLRWLEWQMPGVL